MKKVLSLVLILALVVGVLRPPPSHAEAVTLILGGTMLITTICGLVMVAAGAKTSVALDDSATGKTNTIASLGTSLKARLDVLCGVGGVVGNKVQSWFADCQSLFGAIGIGAKDLISVPSVVWDEAKSLLASWFPSGVTDPHVITTAGVSGYELGSATFDASGRTQTYTLGGVYSSKTADLDIQITANGALHKWVSASKFDHIDSYGDSFDLFDFYYLSPSGSKVNVSSAQYYTGDPKPYVDVSLVSYTYLNKKYITVASRTHTFLHGADKWQTGQWYISTPYQYGDLKPRAGSVPIDGIGKDVLVTPSAVDYPIANPDTLARDVVLTDQGLAMAQGKAGTLSATDMIGALDPAITDADITTDNPQYDEDLNRMKAPNILLQKFPFCIPYDIYNAFAMLASPPATPYFEIPINIERLGVHEKIVIDFEQFKTIAAISRWMLSALFILLLILTTRRVIKG